jgi:hypothetical protein
MFQESEGVKNSIILVNTSLRFTAGFPRTSEQSRMAILEAMRYIILLFIVLPTIAVFLNQLSTKAKGYDEPPQLEETIPFVSNALCFMMRKQAFVVRLR